MPARSRLTLSLAAEVGPGAFGAVFQSQTPGYDISVERSMYFGPNFEVSTGERASHVAVDALDVRRGLARRRAVRQLLPALQPAHAAAAPSTSTSCAPDGVDTVSATTPIPSGRRLTLNANEIPELAGQDFSVIVRSDGGIVAERSMYWRPVGTPPGTPWVGGHTALGHRAPSPEWYFAEGAAAPGFETFYLVFNPYATPITVDANFFTESFGLVQRIYRRCPPGRRQTIYLNAELGNVGGARRVLVRRRPVRRRALDLLGRRAASKAPTRSA